MIRPELRLKNRKGAILFLAAIAVITMAIALAVVIDMSRLHVQRNEMRTSADAAALAGAIQMSIDSNTVDDSAMVIAARNPILNRSLALAGADVVCGIWDPDVGTFTTSAASLRCGGAANAVQVTRRDSSHFLFPQLLHANRVEVRRASVAWLSTTVNRTHCVKPFAVRDTVIFDMLDPFRTTPRVGFTLDDIDLGIIRTHAEELIFCIKDGSSGSAKCPAGAHPGNFDPIQLSASDNGASDYGNNISNPCTGPTPVVGVGDVLAVETGNMAGQTRKGIDQWCSLFSGDDLCTIKLVVWHDEAPGATAPDGHVCKSQSSGSAWCVRVSMIGAAVVLPDAAHTQGSLTGYFTLLDDPGGGIGGTPGMVRRVILVR